MLCSESYRDDEMLDKEKLQNILQWATSEGRVHLLDQLVNQDMKFLWSRPQSKLSTRLKSDQARRLRTNVLKNDF